MLLKTDGLIMCSQFILLEYQIRYIMLFEDLYWGIEVMQPKQLLQSECMICAKICQKMYGHKKIEFCIKKVGNLLKIYINSEKQLSRCVPKKLPMLYL